MLRRREFIVALAALGLSGCKDSSDRRSGGMNSDLDQYPIEDLNAAEEQGILQLREEEKLARDVYIALESKWGLSAFSMIKNSEQMHMDQMALLVGRYDLTDPAKEAQGAFTDPHIQSLYERLVTQGEDSKVSALQVGMTVEDLDIYDIDQVLAQNDNQDIAAIFGTLRQGSIMHMRRFYTDLTASGGAYEPQYISQALFDSIVG